MIDEKKTKGQLIFELKEIRQRVLQLEKITHLQKVKNRSFRKKKIHFREFADMLPEPVFETDPDLNLTYANRRAFELLGYSAEDKRRTVNGLDLIVPEDRNRARENLARRLKGEDIGLVEYQSLKKDGSTFPALLRINAIKQEGNITGFRGIIVDNTGRKQVEEKLRESENRYRSVSELTSDYSYSFKVEPDGKLVTEWVTGALINVTGYTQQELKSLGGWEHLIYPDDMEKPLEQLQSMLSNQANTVEYRITSKDGQVHWMRDYARPMWNDLEKRVTRIQGAVQDITERKLAEQAQYETETKYRSLIENSNDAIYLLYNRKFEIINKTFEQMLGYNLIEVNKPEFDFINLVAPKSRSLIEDRVKQAAKGKKLLPKYEFTALTKGGRELEVEASINYISYNDGIASQGIIRDITDRKRAEQQMERDLQEKTILLSEIHHRVKNSLQVVGSLLHLQSRNITDEHILDLFKQSRNRINMMASVYEQLYQSENFARIDFKQYLEDVLNRMYQLFSANHRVSLKVDVTDVVLGLDDAIPLALILNELFTNSIKYAFPGERKGVIEICFSILDDEAYQLIYKDNGIGLPDHVDFYTTETLGLHLVKMLAKQLHGEATFEQTEWTTFKIVFKGYDHAKKRLSQR
jgi:PAS domain S-box-containing protein